MIEAITSMVFGTIDLLLQLSSKDVKRQKVGKLLLETYDSLGDVVSSMQRMEVTINAFIRASKGDYPSRLKLPDYISVQHISPQKGVAIIQTRSFSEDKTEVLSRPQTVKMVDLLPIALNNDIKDFQKAVGKLSSLMEKQSTGFLTPHLHAFEVYDKRMVSELRRAWDYDSGFICELRRLGISVNEKEKTINIVDVDYYSPRRVSVDENGMFEIYPEQKTFVIAEPEDLEKLIAFLKRSRSIIIGAQEKVRDFIKTHLSIEDIF